MNYLMRVRYAALALLLTASTVLAQSPAPLPAGVTRGPTVEGITEYRLDNGLRVILFPDPSKPTVTVNMTSWSARATKATAKPAWPTCSSTWSSRARRSIPNPDVEFNKRGSRTTAPPGSTAPTTTRPCRRATTT